MLLHVLRSRNVGVGIFWAFRALDVRNVARMTSPVLGLAACAAFVGSSSMRAPSDSVLSYWPGSSHAASGLEHQLHIIIQHRHRGIVVTPAGIACVGSGSA